METSQADMYSFVRGQTRIISITFTLVHVHIDTPNIKTSKLCSYILSIQIKFAMWSSNTSSLLCYGLSPSK